MQQHDTLSNIVWYPTYSATNGKPTIKVEEQSYYADSGLELIVDYDEYSFVTYATMAYTAALAVAGLPPDFSVGQPLKPFTGRQVLKELFRYVSENPGSTPAVHSNWVAAWKSSPQKLGHLLSIQAAQCRERALALHILLAEFGIPTVVAHAPGHAWVVHCAPDGTPLLGLDPACDKIDFEDPLFSKKFSVSDLQWCTVVAPIKPNDPLLTKPKWFVPHQKP